MNGVNKVILVGTLGADPEVRHTQSGSQVTNVRMVTNEKWKDKSGEMVEKAEWHRVVFFARLAEIAGEYLRKGSQVYVEGKIQTTKYEKDGQDRYSTDIVARELQMLGGKQDAPREKMDAPKKAEAAPSDFDDDIPF